ncbi:MAG: hypothetical protein LUQ71_03600, partial [Methanoregula sp.]|nr:hypothetical protein [Methanoregula sp.]
RAVPKMPATSAVLEEVKEIEQQMDIDGLAAAACTGLRFVTALDGRITEESSGLDEREPHPAGRD